MFKSKHPMAVALCVMACLLGGAPAISSKGAMQSHAGRKTNAAQAQASQNEKWIWHLELAYWRHVQDNNLDAYLNLWSENFLGWPSVSATPVHKDHITDWITSQTGKGLAMKNAELTPAAIQITGNVAVTCYWVTCKWLGKDGKGEAYKTRITHTWVKEGVD